MRAAVVAADDAVPDGLARAGHAHRQIEQAHRGGRLRILVEHRLVAAHAGEMIDVARLGHAHDGVDQQVGLRLLGGAEGQFLMRAVQRVARLEGHDAPPAELAEQRAQLVGRVAPTAEIVMHRLLDAGDRPAQIDRPGGVMQVVHRRMCGIIGAEDLRGLLGLVGRPAVGDRHGPEDHPLHVAQRDVLTDLDPVGEGLGHIEGDGHRPERAIGQPQRVHHAGIVGLGHESLERVEPAIHQKLQIADLPPAEIPADQLSGLEFQFLGAVVRDIKLGDGGEIGQMHRGPRLDCEWKWRGGAARVCRAIDPARGEFKRPAAPIRPTAPIWRSSADPRIAARHRSPARDEIFGGLRWINTRDQADVMRPLIASGTGCHAHPGFTGKGDLS